MRALTGSTSKDKAIFVEDDFAKDLCDEIIRQYAKPLIEQVEIHKAGGYPYVVEVLKHHNLNPTIKNRAVAIIDGDNAEAPEKNSDVLRLPDGAPESIVFDYIKENAESVAALVQQRCQCPSVSQDEIVKTLNSVYIDTTDHHLYFEKLGEKLGFISSIVIRRGLCSIYVQNSYKELKTLVETLTEKMLK